MTNENNKWQKFKETADLEEASALDTESNPVSEHALENETPSAKVQPGLEHPSYEALEEKLTLSEQQNFEYREKVARLNAELDNVRKRAEKDVAGAYQFGAEKLIKGLLPVIDSLDQAILLMDKESQTAMYDGLHLTQKLFLDTLEKQGVTVIDPLSLPFDPKEHEAMAMQASETHAPNTVMMVFQKGYRLHDRVIRAAKVIVAK